MKYHTEKKTEHKITEDNESTKRHRPMSRKQKALRVLLIIVVVLAVLIVGALVAYFSWEKAPEIAATPAPSPSMTVEPEESPEPTEQLDNGIPYDTSRQDGIYTLLLVGNDAGTGNTDTMMLAKFDTVNHKVDVISLPRDTLINNYAAVKKLNSVYWGAESGNGEGIEALRSQVKQLSGFDFDCYAVIDLDVFVDFIDAIGGVWFDVPVEIEVEDWMGDMYDYWDTIEPGYQHLNGFQSEAVCRHRQGYITGDLGRIEVQHDFLKAAAKQFISLGNLPNAKKAVQILADGLTTNLTSANIAYFLRQALMCDPDDINFYTLPTTPEMIQGYSYAVIKLNSWLEMINTYLNPYDVQITAGNLNVVYMSDGKYYGTNGLADPDYFAETKPSPSPSASPSVSPSESVEPTITPEIVQPTPSAEPTAQPTDTPADQQPTDQQPTDQQPTDQQPSDQQSDQSVNP